MAFPNQLKKRYAVVKETWTVLVHDHYFADRPGDESFESSQFHWEENHCSQNELRKLCESILARLDKDDAESVCNACAHHEAKLLGVYDTIEEAEKAHRAIRIEADDYEPPPGRTTDED
jgi:hypothetical protein